MWKTASQIGDEVLQKLALSQGLLAAVGAKAGMKALKPGMSGLQGLHALEDVGNRAPRMVKSFGVTGGNRMNLSPQRPRDFEAAVNHPQFQEQRSAVLNTPTPELARMVNSSPETLQQLSNPIGSQLHNIR